MTLRSVLKDQHRSLTTEEAAESSLELLTPTETAKLLRVSLKTLYRRTQAGELPARKVGGQIRYNKTDLERWWKGESL